MKFKVTPSGKAYFFTQNSSKYRSIDDDWDDASEDLWFKVILNKSREAYITQCSLEDEEYTAIGIDIEGSSKDINFKNLDDSNIFCIGNISQHAHFDINDQVYYWHVGEFRAKSVSLLDLVEIFNSIKFVYYNPETFKIKK